MGKFYSFLFFFTVIFLIDLYGYQAIKTVMQNNSQVARRTAFVIHWTLSAFALGTIVYLHVTDFYALPKMFRIYLPAFLVITYISKLLIVPFMIMDDLIRGARWIVEAVGGPSTGSEGGISRLKFLSQLGLLAAGIPFVSLVHGMIKNPYNYQLHRIKLPIAGLPGAFRGMKIVQLSDIHSGSFTRTAPLIEAVNKINKEEADLVFFTGDLVNDRADEIHPYIDIFSKIKAKRGVYSILGNHDYGDYYRWPSKEAKATNMERMKEAHKKLGWNLLLNQHEIIREGNDELAIIGVENWSNKGRFRNYGDMAKAYQGSEKAGVKLLLSHDPSHWEAEITTDYPDISAMFAGHTHGMQFGVEIPGFKWSPVQYMYKQWAGLYTKAKQHLYVNRGFGFIGYPGRVGILPEITIFELL